MSKLTKRGVVELVNLYPDQYHDDSVNAHVRQEIITEYRGDRGPFMNEESDPVETYSSYRYAFVPVPVGWGEEKVAEKVKDGTVQRIFGCIPESVMSENQKARLASLPPDEAKELREKILNNITSVDGKTGEIIMFEGHESYGRNQFVLGQVEDLDFRREDVAALEASASDPVFEEDTTDEPIQVAQ